MSLRDKTELVPVINIQCDWEEFIEIPRKNLWVSCKFRDQPSAFGKIQGVTAESDTNDFTATLGRNSICIRFNQTNHLCRFLPPSKTFSHVHEKAVISIDAADGGLGVSVCSGQKLTVWDNNSGEVRRLCNGHIGDIYKCRFFPSGIVILSAGSDMSIKIWSAETGQCPVTLKGHVAAITDICILDRGRNVISVSKDGTTRLWDCGQSACLAVIAEINQTIICCSIGEVPDLVPIVSPSNEREIGTGNKILLVGTDEGSVYAIAVASRQVLYDFSVGSSVNAISYFSKDFFITGAQDGKLTVYRLSSGDAVTIFHESNSPILCIAQFQDKGVLVGRNDGTVTYYSLVSDTSDRLQLTGSDCDPIYDISVTLNYVFTACRDGKIRRYHVSDLIAGGI